MLQFCLIKCILPELTGPDLVMFARCLFHDSNYVPELVGITLLILCQ